MRLPPGPGTPSAVQTVEWVARPTDLLRRSAARFGEPFTLRTLWADAPMVLVSDPDTVKRVYAAPPESLRGGESSTVLEPFAGPSSILLTSGEEHMRRRKLMLPPFHGERMEAHRATVAALAEAELDRWEPGRPLRTLWADGPMVVFSDPQQIRRVYAEPETKLHGGESSTVLEPFAGASSILLLSGEAHMRQRKLMLPPFHGERMEAHRATVAELAAGELDRWEPGRPLRTLPRMQELTLDVILRVVLGAPDAQLRAAIRAALDMTTSLPRLIALSLAPHGSPPWRGFEHAVARVDALLRAAITARRAAIATRPDAAGGRPGAADGIGGDRAAPRPVIDDLIAAGSTDAELRDQVVTLLAAGHETTAGSLAWALERLARHPRVAARLRDGGDDYLDATVKEVLRIRPVLSVTPRKLAAPLELGGWTLPPGVHVTPCIYLAHRRPELWPDPTAFKPERFVDGAPAPYSWLPFGGGVRRCAGAAFATMELREVLRAVVRRFELRPDRPGGERMRRRGVTLTPSRGGRVVPLA